LCLLEEHARRVHVGNTQPKNLEYYEVERIPGGIIWAA
jgi:hypothetical protein